MKANRMLSYSVIVSAALLATAVFATAMKRLLP